MSGRSSGREVLPIPDRPHLGPVPFDAKDPSASFKPIEPLRPPQGAPNVLVVLLDDVGFGASSAFGGLCETPTAERLAGNGLKYNRFHTTALCSPTRLAFLTGRNHHSVGFGNIANFSTSAPGYTSIRPNSAATISETLKLNGYSTAMFGKCHEVPPWETSPLGPFGAWPTGGGGFEYFYGFLSGMTHQNSPPALYEGTTPVYPGKSAEEGYHITEDMTDKAIAWVRQQKALMPDKPFFLYYAPGATHSPHHVPPEWADKYKGRFDQGWDALREEVFERQKALGVIPADAELTARHDEIPAWDEMPEELKPFLIRQAELYAGFLEHTDFQIGRLVDSVDELGALENTLIYYIIGDNGASAEGTVNGTFNELLTPNGFDQLETPEYLLSRMDELGGPSSYNNYSLGWAHAMNTPFQWTKQVASHWGGTRNGLVVHWPAGMAARGEVRTQFHHVIDVAPTILEAAGLPQPTLVNGVQQKPIEGVSMAYSFDGGADEERRPTQYFEMMGNRGIYHEGWTAVTKHRTPWVMGVAELADFDDDVWELYDTSTDWSQARNVVGQYPEKLAELQRLWLMEAVKYQVLPLDDRFIERANPDLAGRPKLIRGDKQLLFAGMERLTEHAVLNIKNKTHTVTAEISVPETGADGVIIAQGGAWGGWSLYAKDGRLTYCYNAAGIELTRVAAERPLEPGTHIVRMRFDYDGGGLGKGGAVTLSVDGQADGEGRVRQTMPFVFSIDETCDVGRDCGNPVSPDYELRANDFSGAINWVELATEGAEADSPGFANAKEWFELEMIQQ